MREINQTVASGVVAGIFLGLFLKAVEYITGLKVYTLLLNVDYIAILKDYAFPEFVEFVFHLVISVLLSLVTYYYLLKRTSKMRLVINLSLLVGFLLYPTTMLSDRTPEINSTYAFLFWMLGHGLYGVVLGWMLTNIRRNEGR
ncbi:hypothetical protein [Mesobacillus subterraneus]|uniref:DUF1440 domain-containing protein n=1 Tax=Mesobacillus subterraneus TaxID=285983 RepID=A0A3R9F4U6_9BACI|nr:hypothetical protein [Mesobacillus subterraneus]RSD29053.1 hypothetical protein EJA10_02790 [Mesobacillus subterraneus]